MYNYNKNKILHQQRLS